MPRRLIEGAQTLSGWKPSAARAQAGGPLADHARVGPLDAVRRGLGADRAVGRPLLSGAKRDELAVNLDHRRIVDLHVAAHLRLRLGRPRGALRGEARAPVRAPCPFFFAKLIARRILLRRSRTRARRLSTQATSAVEFARRVRHSTRATDHRQCTGGRLGP